MQNEIVTNQKLLDEFGHIINPGYSRSMLQEYNRKDIKANKLRIKEWDYYLVANDQYGIALTVADNSYMGFISVSLLNFKDGWFKTSSIIKPLTMGKLNLPASSKTGDIKYNDKRINIEINNLENKRHLICEMKNFQDNKTFKCDVILSNEPKDSMVIATPFKESRKAFYYNQKINCMRADGLATFDNIEYKFSIDNSFSVLDWGRGVWTYKNTWYWGSGSGLVNGKTFGFNIGYGFGDTSAASENMIFYDGIAHKIDQVEFHIPTDGENDDFMKPWKFTSNDNRFEMDFSPILDRSDKTDILLISSDQHQVFGKFSGKAVLDDGTVIEIKDFLGFAEKVSNRW